MEMRTYTPESAVTDRALRDCRAIHGPYTTVQTRLLARDGVSDLGFVVPIEPFEHRTQRRDPRVSA